MGPESAARAAWRAALFGTVTTLLTPRKSEAKGDPEVHVAAARCLLFLVFSVMGAVAIAEIIVAATRPRRTARPIPTMIPLRDLVRQQQCLAGSKSLEDKEERDGENNFVET